jgi:hypothetical protein
MTILPYSATLNELRGWYDELNNLRSREVLKISTSTVHFRYGIILHDTQIRVGRSLMQREWKVFIVILGFCSRPTCSKYCPEANITLTVPALICGLYVIKCRLYPVCEVHRISSASNYAHNCISCAPFYTPTFQPVEVASNETGIREIIPSSMLDILKAN